MHAYMYVHFSAYAASRFESQQYKPAHSHLGQEVKKLYLAEPVIERR